ncbi:MAG TPA: ATPase [Novosphingobium sp.]|nr:ATPase [Novosphingobium sp.]
MTGGSRIVAIGTGGQEATPEAVIETSADDTALTLEEAWEENWEAEEPPARRTPWRGFAAPLFALLAIAAWTGAFGWAHRAAMLAPATIDQWLGWIGDWSGPVLLVCVLWLIAMRNSAREAARFGNAARSLGEESARLEERLTSINRELSLAREFIAAQSRDIDSLGRVATERLSQHSERLAGLIHDNGARIDTIGSVSATALENMERLRGQLPVIASSAKDVTNHIANAGRTAQAQLQDMINGFGRLNDFGQASERQVMALRTRIDEAIGEFDNRTAQLDEHTTARFAALHESSEEFRTQLDGHEVEALAAIRSRASALGEELATAREVLDANEAESLASLRTRLAAVRDESGTVTRSLREGESSALAAWKTSIERLEEELRTAITRVDAVDSAAVQSARNRVAELAHEAAEVDTQLAERERHFADETARRQVETEERDAAFLARLQQQMALLDNEIAARRTEQEEQSRRLAAHSAEIATQLGAFSHRMIEVSEHGGQAEAALAASLQALATNLASSREALGGTDRAISELTDSSVRLLELIQASATHSQVDLPTAIAVSEERLGLLEARAIALRDVVGEASGRGEMLSDYVVASQQGLSETLAGLDQMHVSLGQHAATHGETLGGLQAALGTIRNDSEAIAQHAQDELRSAIGALTESAQAAVAGIEQMSATQVTALASRLGEESGAAIDKAMRARAAEAVGMLEQAAAHASGVSREAAVQLRDQLAKVNELAGNLERRVAQARERAEEQVDNDFARRVALITEALNSNAIDIAKAIDTDVSDTAWASYLRGDRGVFTRRAVRLLEPTEAKSVAQIYESDRDFREHVSHYIHDFEAMLRQLLSTRDGHSLGVTLLSSDMGKLYVALAQAIERLRN